MANEKSILYFDEVGEKNTDETLKSPALLDNAGLGILI